MSGGKSIDVSEILDECKRSRMMFFSGGGVTFTGGEATVQKEELAEILRLLKSEDIHTAIETNGTSEYLPEILEYTDYLMMDFKHYDSAAHEKYTKMPDRIIRQNYEYNCQRGRQQHIRIPLINGINADNPEAFARYFSSFDTKNTAFEFLLYHEYGKQKWQEEYQVKDGFVSAQTLEDFKNTFEKYNLNIIYT